VLAWAAPAGAVWPLAFDATPRLPVSIKLLYYDA
jgi:hypothetical protein